MRALAARTGDGGPWLEELRLIGSFEVPSTIEAIKVHGLPRHVRTVALRSVGAAIGELHAVPIDAFASSFASVERLTIEAYELLSSRQGHWVGQGAHRRYVDTPILLPSVHLLRLDISRIRDSSAFYRTLTCPELVEVDYALGPLHRNSFIDFLTRHPRVVRVILRQDRSELYGVLKHLGPRPALKEIVIDNFGTEDDLEPLVDHVDWYRGKIRLLGEWDLSSGFRLKLDPLLVGAEL
jgi:hypothetical protein